MFGKAEWFMRRKWLGWGLYPVVWQGWAYIAIFVILIFGTQYLPIHQTGQMIALGVVALLLVLDTIVMMAKLKKDERETLHEALAERNALWAILAILAAGVAYQAATSLVQNKTLFVDPVIIAAVVGGLIAKAATNFYLDKKN